MPRSKPVGEHRDADAIRQIHVLMDKFGRLRLNVLPEGYQVQRIDAEIHAGSGLVTRQVTPVTDRAESPAVVLMQLQDRARELGNG